MIDANDPRHGTNAGYVAHSLAHDPPCEPCRQAHADYRRGLRARRYLKRANRLYIDATGTQRRIRALVALGWTYNHINARCGWDTGHAGGHSYNITRQTRVHVDTAAKIKAAYDELSMTLADHPLAGRQRELARSKGWPPPLCWSEDTIDDPTAKPAGMRDPKAEITTRDAIDPITVERVLLGENLPTTTAERREITRRWIASGGSEAALCRRMSWRQGRYSERKAS